MPNEDQIARWQVAIEFTMRPEYVRGMTAFAKVLESADHLSLTEQEALLDTLARRVAEQRRAELVIAVKEARAEYAGGCCKASTRATVLKKIIG